MKSVTCPNCGYICKRPGSGKSQRARDLMDGTLTAPQIAARVGLADSRVYRIAADEGLPIKRTNPPMRKS